MSSKIPAIRNLKTQADAFVYFLQKMDIEMIDLVLDNGITYQDFEKKEFIHLLGEALDILSSKGDTFLLACPGYCNSKTCNFKLKGYLLRGNKSGDYLNFLIQTEANRISNLFECCSFKCAAKQKLFGERIYIDSLREPF